jgi:HD-like signal output (HDOD) protein
MTSRLLPIFNSAIYSFLGEVSTILRAITIMGTQVIYHLMLVDEAATAIKHFTNQLVDLKRFWHFSAFCDLASILALVAYHPEIFSYEDCIDATLCQTLKISTEDLKTAENFSTIETDNIFNIMNANFYG